VIVAASGVLGFWQERTAGHAVDALMAQVRVAVEVRRGGGQVSVPVEEVVVGDLVVLRAGDVVPADGRVVRSRELLVDEAALTGESYAVEKRPGVVAADTPLAARRLRTGFERGITQFGVLLVRAMVVLVTAIFVVNLVLHRPLVDSLLFSLALAVGLTPQLLPAIVSVSLSAGARRMAADKVIVKRLDAIEDFGAMTVLCTDKTGTITAGAVHLDRVVDPSGRAGEEVLRLARLNAGLQRSFPNPLDHGSPLLVTKGAFDKVLEVCATEAIRRLAGLDVSVRLVTGDNRLAARKVAAAVGLQAEHLLTGGDIDRLDDPAWPGGPATPRCSPRSSPSTRSASSARCVGTIRSSASSATGSTTPPPCTPPTSASRSTPRSTWPGRRPPSCCSTRAWPWPPGSCRSSPARSCCSTSCPTSPV
jgi:magnesium-transporting ATPase (P-type)